MKYLGIDYGKSKVGLSLSYGKLAEPYKVMWYEDSDNLIEQINSIVIKEKIDKIVVGVSEGEMGNEQKGFARKINAEIFDETLSTQDAIFLSIESGMKRKKRKAMEDAYAASIMLQNYLDSLN